MRRHQGGRGQRRTQSEIRRLLARLESSGLTQAAFAESVGVPLSTLTGWKRRFGGAEGDEDTRLVPVRLTGDAPLSLPAADGVGSGEAFEVALRSGHSIKVPAGFCGDSLKLLIGILDGP